MEYSVLIIDDDIWMQRILAKTMESYGFKHTFLASNAFEGIALSVEYAPTLIIMDILMPELSGLIALKILKHIKVTRDIPILMVSALSDTENLSIAFKYGTAGFISKPFTRSTIFEKLIGIFGKEKLEQISLGERIDTTNLPKQTESEALADSADLSQNEIDLSVPTDKKTISKTVPQEQLLQYYQEDEKRSIDAIKKMLLKKKK